MIPSLVHALDDARVSSRDFQVLFLLAVLELDVQEFRELKANPIARKLKTSVQTVNRSLVNLTNCGYLAMRPRLHPGALHAFRLSYSVALPKMEVPKAS